ncbi:alpha/beta hydrolase [Gordonia hydrophobica]|uniref:Alpha/beta hydrolase fold domain-containing protein n=1 Tax=Gordonia hydrophobica TaxID=40516 RepID=A0ABZ2U4D3_9ACTN|nr:alpha/beta hydrolase fold domain-containing protein [Gordonia hydrophobica]MBM7368322.1 acetyl esterase/lipase [Gordonia hydrophobica]
MSVINHDERDARSFVLLWFCRLIVKTLLRFIPISEGLLRRLAMFDEWAGRDRRTIRGVTIEKSVIADAPVERITPTLIDDPRTVVLYLHGGAFIACGLNTHRAVASEVARDLRAPLVNVDYRQCPQAGVGTSIHDAYAVYRELRAADDVDTVVVAGDSAGGYLAAKIVDYAARDGIAGPDAYIGFSPLLNLAPDAERSSRHDAMLPVERLEELRPFYDRGPEPLDGALDATADVVAQHFPPAILVCAADEALEKDARDLSAALDRFGVPNEIHLYAGQIHAFPAAATGSRQGKNAVRIATGFVRKSLDASGQADAASA